MKFVNEILGVKGRDVWRVSPDTSVFDALGIMADKNVGALMVLEDDELVGVFSERDYARKIILEGKASRRTTVREIMSDPHATVTPKDTVEDCMQLMTNERVRHLPVVDGGKLVGVISIGDVVKSIISEHEFTIRQLEKYIDGRV